MVSRMDRLWSSSTSFAPEPPLFVSRYSLYPLSGTAARKKLTALAIMGCPALVTGAVSESTLNASNSTGWPEEMVDLGHPNTVKTAPSDLKQFLLGRQVRGEGR